MVKTFDYQKYKILACKETPEFRLKEKEPETIQWLEKYIKPDDIFFDIGANVGSYSLISAKLGAKVYSFEPAATNFNLLLQNVYLNNLQNEIKLFPFVIGDYSRAKIFIYKDLKPGSTHGVYWGGTVGHLTYQFSLEELLTNSWIKFPNHIKIDVDGYENGVLNGMHNILRKGIKTMQIEFWNRNLSIANWIVNEFGYKIINKTKRNNPEFTNILFEWQ